MENEQTTQNLTFAKILTLEDISEINRVLGIIEGMSYGVENVGIAEGLNAAVDRIDAVINNGGGEDGK